MPRNNYLALGATVAFYTLAYTSGERMHAVSQSNVYERYLNEKSSKEPNATKGSKSPKSKSPSKAPKEPKMYYMGYNTGGCVGRNELGITTKPVVEECAAACDALPTCVSFEYKRSSTRCQLSSTCTDFSMTVDNPGDTYMWYLKVTKEVNTSGNPTPYAYLRLLNNISGGVVTLTTTNYYIGYDTGGCVGRNELGITTKPVVEECAAACNALRTCVSFEYKRSSTRCQLSSTCTDFSMTVDNPGDTYMWYEKASNGYTAHVATRGSAYLWLIV